MNTHCKECGVFLKAGINCNENTRTLNYPLCHSCRSVHGAKYRGTYTGQPNKECSVFLGVHVAEEVLSKVFTNVERMPYGHIGYDFKCNHNKLIDVKSSCRITQGAFTFSIKYNTTPDYFLCVAFDNREDLNPLHLWLIPGSIVNHKSGISISKHNMNFYEPYKLDISKVIKCCDGMKG